MFIQTGLWARVGKCNVALALRRGRGCCLGSQLSLTIAQDLLWTCICHTALQFGFQLFSFILPTVFLVIVRQLFKYCLWDRILTPLKFYIFVYINKPLIPWPCLKPTVCIKCTMQNPFPVVATTFSLSVVYLELERANVLQKQTQYSSLS